MDRFFIDLHQSIYLFILDRFGLMRGTVHYILAITSSLLMVADTKSPIVAILLILSLLLLIPTTWRLSDRQRLRRYQ